MDAALPALETYRARRDAAARERDDLTRRWNLLANLRLLAFVAGAGLLGWGIWARTLILAGAGAALLLAFAALAWRHAALGRARRHAATRHAINAEALARLARGWDDLPLRHDRRADPSHPYAVDLDLLGPASLLHLLDTTTTPLGQQTLVAWLLAPAPIEPAGERQGAVAELAPLLDLRQELEARGRLRDVEKPDPRPFLAWAGGDRWLAHRPWLRLAAWVFPAAFWGAVAGGVLGLLPGGLWIPLLVLNAVISQLLSAGAHGVVRRATAQGPAILPYATMLELVDQSRFDAPLLKRLQGELETTGHPAHAELARLARLATWEVPRASPLHLPLQALAFWDVHLLAALERWQAANGRQVRRWLEILAEIEALAALSGPLGDEPGWSLPALDPEAAAVQAEALAHPLLAPSVRVANGVTVGPSGSVLLVTGSNMSGKSTLLRAIGVNAVLAMAGGPVCAERMTLPPVAVWTSMRVTDSLAEGVSYYLAELRRLKAVVDAAEVGAEGRWGGGAVNSSPSAPPPLRPSASVLYLLDEILQGTNTTERRIAARRIVLRLVRLGAIGAVSTHDLDLADPEAAPALAASSRPIHFSESVASDGMSFDYRARPGIATSTNALRLMELVGLELEDE